MNALQSFSFENKPVRVVLVDGDPWWVARDVCNVLEIVNPRDAVTRLDDDERGVVSTDTPGGLQQTTTVSEAGLYSLILGSRKPEARTFKRWITHDVIPAIRKTGNYALAARVPQTLQEALRLAADQLDTIERQNEQLAIDAPKVEIYDACMSADNTQSMAHVAKMLGVGPRKIFDMLREAGIFTGRVPMQRYIQHFDVKETPVLMGDTVKNVAVTRVKPSGIEFIARKLGLVVGR